MGDNIQLFSISSLHTIAGASLAVLLIVQAIKDLPGIKTIPTRGLAILIGEGLFLLTTTPFPSSVGGGVVLMLNGLLSASTAIGGWHLLDSAQSAISSQMKK